MIYFEYAIIGKGMTLAQASNVTLPELPGNHDLVALPADSPTAAVFTAAEVDQLLASVMEANQWSLMIAVAIATAIGVLVGYLERRRVEREERS